MVEETGIPRENEWHYSGRAKLGVYVCVLVGEGRGGGYTFVILFLKTDFTTRFTTQ